MKIIQVPRRFVADEWGGTETTILQSCRSLNAMSNHCEIYTTLALSDTRAEQIQGVSIRRFPYCYPFFGLSDEAIVDMDKKGGNLLSLSLLWGLRKAAGVDVLHAHTGKRLGGIVRTAARQKNIPYVISLHGGFFDVPKNEMQQMLAPIRNTWEWGKPFGALLGSRNVLSDAAAVICVGNNEYKAAKKALPNQRVEFLPNGVDSAFFAEGEGAAFRQHYDIPDDKKIILCIGRIDYQKNQLGLVEALPSILASQPDAHLVLIGPVTVAGYHEKLVKLVEKLGLGQNITLIPGMNSDDAMLTHAYHAADVFCLPSLHEPFGIVILEAWAAGCPVAAAEIGGIPSFTHEGEDILRFDPEKPAAIAATVLRLLNDSDLAGKLAARGHEKARDEYDWSKVSAQLLNIYQQVASY
ncbi:MAG: glycosyltransferase family 4 protein [Mariprofundaceae bacterium]